MRVLIACPIYQIYSQTIQSILTLDWPGRVDTVLLQNEPSEETDAYTRILRKYQDARRLCLQGGYDALLTIEADMLVPSHALTALAETGADVAYGLYCWRHAQFGYAWSAYSMVGGVGGMQGRSLSDDVGEARRLWGQRIVVAGVGTGCTLIRRHVLEQIDFRRAGTPSHDWFFAIDCQAARFSQVCDTSVACGHIQGEQLIFPDPDAPELARFDPLM